MATEVGGLKNMYMHLQTIDTPPQSTVYLQLFSRTICEN